MLINSQCVAEAPSRRAATAGSRRLAEFGLGAVVRPRGQGRLAAEAGRMSGIGGGGDNAAAGYLASFAGSFQPGQLAASPVQASKVQASVVTKSASVVTKSTVQNSTDQHNSIQAIRLVPASRGEVGPYPVREPGPA